MNLPYYVSVCAVRGHFLGALLSTGLRSETSGFDLALGLTVASLALSLEEKPADLFPHCQEVRENSLDTTVYSSNFPPFLAFLVQGTCLSHHVAIHHVPA